MTKNEEQAALNLLARIHRDGGHHTGNVGFIQSCEDAERKWLELMEVLDLTHYALKKVGRVPNGPTDRAFKRLCEIL